MLVATNIAMIASSTSTTISSTSVKPPPLERRIDGRWPAGAESLGRDTRIRNVVRRARLPIRPHRDDVVTGRVDAAGELVNVGMLPGIERDIAHEVGAA